MPFGGKDGRMTPSLICISSGSGAVNRVLLIWQGAKGCCGVNIVNMCQISVTELIVIIMAIIMKSKSNL